MNTKLTKLSTQPVFVSLADYIRLKDRFVTIEHRHYLPTGNELKPVRIAWNY